MERNSNGSSSSWWSVLLLCSALLLARCDRFLCFGCPVEEYQALLELRLSMVHFFGSSPPTWASGKDCCLWERVSCNNNTKRVSTLSLSELPQIQDDNLWMLDFSIFSSFHQLQHLDLSGNRIASSLAGIPKLKKLESLDLSSNLLTGSIPSSLRKLSSLTILNLQHNGLNGTLDAQALDGLRNLHELHVGYNHLNGSFPQSLGRLSLLQHLDLSNNLMEGDIPPLFSNLTSLQYLDLSNNYLNGHLSFHTFANNSKLEVIKLSNNVELSIDLNDGGHFPSFQLRTLRLSRCIVDKETLASPPAFLSSQYKLEGLDLSHNNLHGNFPLWLLENQTGLEYLTLVNNSLSGPFHLPDHPKESIKAIDISMNFLTGSLPANMGMKLPNVFGLDFSSNYFIGDVPASLGNMSYLEILALSDNTLTGEIPTHLFNNCSFLKIVALSNNNLHGAIPQLNYGWEIAILSLDGNQLSGTIPSNLSGSVYLEVLHVHDNRLSGEIPDSFGVLAELISLNLGGNHFEGRIPSQLCKLMKLDFLDLSHNKLSGSLPICTFSSAYVNVAGNALTGSIPEALFNNSNLVALDASNNQLSGSLPTQIRDKLNVTYLSLRRNYLEGPIPNQFCNLKSLGLLDLSQNGLSGSLPPCFGQMQSYAQVVIDNSSKIWRSKLMTNVTYPVNPKAIWEGYIVGQQMEFLTKGSLYAYQMKQLVLMSGIDLSANKLTGSIPPEIGNLRGLISLNLSHNQLTGLIPETLSNLSQIESLDLSHNQLSGVIPWQLTQLKSLEVFSVAYNNLSGCTPEPKYQFSTFNEGSYVGNSGLHGPPLDRTCASNSSLLMPHEEHQEDDNDDEVDNIIFYAISTASFIIAFWVCIAFLHCNHIGQRFRIQMMDRHVDFFTEWIFLTAYKLKQVWS